MSTPTSNVKQVVKEIAFHYARMRLLRNELAELLDEGKQRDVRLSRRERQILALLAQGYSEKQIMARLIIARSTLCNLRNRLYKKIDVNNCVHAARYAWAHGIVDPEEAWETVMTKQWRELPESRKP